MAKLKGLKGVAKNLATSFTSPTNTAVLELVSALRPETKRRLIFQVWPAPRIRGSRDAPLSRYHDWLLVEAKKLGLAPEDLTSAHIVLTYHPGKALVGYLGCTVTIRAHGKKFTGGAVSSYG